MEMLLQLQPELVKLEDKFGPHPLTKEIKIIHNRRLELAGLISSQMQLLERANNEYQQEAVKLTKGLVKLCFLKIRKGDKDEVGGRLDFFFKELDKNFDILEATTELGLKIYIDELREMHVNHTQLVIERIRSIASRHTRQSKAIQKDCQAVLRSVFAQIELAQKLYPDQDYTQLIERLNNVIAKFTRLIKRRATYNNKKALTKAKKATEMEAKSHSVCVDGKVTGSMIIDEESMVEKKKVKSTTKAKVKKQEVAPKTETIKPQKKDNRVMDILKLPPGEKS